jgi:hypothetical protein
LFEEAVRDGITISEWIHDRILSGAGVADHESQGRALHSVEVCVRWPRMFVYSLGRQGNWDW